MVFLSKEAIFFFYVSIHDDSIWTAGSQQMTQIWEQLLDWFSCIIILDCVDMKIYQTSSVKREFLIAKNPKLVLG